MRHITVGIPDDPPLDPDTAARIVRALLRGPDGVTAQPFAVLARLPRRKDLRAQYAAAWLGVVLRTPFHRGPALSDSETENLPRAAITEALRSIVDDGVPIEDAGGRLRNVPPPGHRQRVRLLALAADTAGIGLEAVFVGTLASPRATVADRDALLDMRWADVVDEYGPPGCLADAPLPRRVPTLRLSRRGLVVLIAASVLTAGAAATGRVPFSAPVLPRASGYSGPLPR